GARRARLPARTPLSPRRGEPSPPRRRPAPLRITPRSRPRRPHRDRRVRVHALARRRPHRAGAGEPPPTARAGARMVHAPLGGGHAPRRARPGRSRGLRPLLRVPRRRGADTRRDDLARECLRATLLPRFRGGGRGWRPAMKLVAATLYALRIPFVESFSHSAGERRWADSVVVRVRDDVGTEGDGEGTPRPYVTGETVEPMPDHLANELWPRVADREVPSADDLEAFASFPPETHLAGAIAPH